MNRGRGRGRGGATGPRPVARDDEGNIVETKPEGPPPLYPEKPLPPLPDAAKAAEAEPFLAGLGSHFKSSAFNLGRPEDRAKRAACNASLASVVTLDPSYFPKELYSEQQKSRGGSKAAQAAYWEAHAAAMAAGDGAAAAAGGGGADDDPLALGRMDELAKRESARRDAEGEAPGVPLAAEEEEGDAEAEAYDDEDFVGDDDDPYQQFDDDEGYEDPDEEGGGDDAYF